MRLLESEIINRIRATFPGGEALTDDCGALPRIPEGHRMLVTTDVMEEDIHFRRAWHPPALLGRKLLAVNLSDLDASGARPLGFTLTLSLEGGLDPEWVIAFLDGLAEVAREQGVPILGGDTVGRPRGIGLGITALGEARRWLRRDTMEAGDRIYVDRPLGLSYRGLRKLMGGGRHDPLHPDPEILAHLDPRPNLGLGRRLADMDGIHACIDLSDGLSKDLRALAEASGLSVVLDPGLDTEAVEGGEDYARCFTSPLSRGILEQALAMPLIQVGHAVSRGEAGLLQQHGQGLAPYPDRSFDHFARPRHD
jgi:thiamine-monophosphate kinase